MWCVLMLLGYKGAAICLNSRQAGDNTRKMEKHVSFREAFPVVWCVNPLFLLFQCAVFRLWQL
ncbi:hypothetical protein SAMN02910291_01375 [Desulfovibrio desulfuricans]|uniref:Uncharacterized protein n=1 Tax=Desulfovibrio desulfuricans TaxID=876 RepID=A0AA94HSL1_DESDE|nr:hypothetical protein CNY67_05345 [Desulfovibrio sp. G11]SFW45770.1 hypothetical protein SAMN02910291_01375 [Desulfovibrio desulfuricans]SPD36453.1 Hypothetical protein DSVG11_2372 [Desulfovibrio sp. G11]